MKKIFLILLFYFSLIVNGIAASKIYLKCPKIITENRSIGMFTVQEDLERWPYNVGNKINTMFVYMKLGKSSAKIKPYHYDYLKTGDLIFKNLSLGKPIPAELLWDGGKPRIFKVKKESNGGFTIDQSYKMMNLPTDLGNEITKMTWTLKNGEWYFKDLLYIKFDDAEVKIKSESKCINITEKEFKNYLKEGEGLNFYN